jgi:hypothetical protein
MIGQDFFGSCECFFRVMFEPTSSLKSLGQSAFMGTGLRQITIPKSVTVNNVSRFFAMTGHAADRASLHHKLERPRGQVSVSCVAERPGPFTAAWQNERQEFTMTGQLTGQ